MFFPSGPSLRSSRLLGAALLGATLLTAVVAQQAHGQLLEYTFNETGTVANNSGTATGANLTFNNSSAAAADLHSAAGGGVSGAAGDRSFDNTASTQMGGSGTTPVGGDAFNTAATASAFNGLTALTLTGWYNASSAPFATGARLMISSSQALTLNFNTNTLSLLVTTASGSGTVNIPTTATAAYAAANTANSWVYYAATYDNTTLRLYIGTSTTAAVSVASVALTGAVNAGNGLYLGNVPGLQRPFDGLIDDVRLYGSALTLTDINNIRSADLVPEPASWVWLGTAALGGGVMLRRHRSRAKLA